MQITPEIERAARSYIKAAAYTYQSYHAWENNLTIANQVSLRREYIEAAKVSENALTNLRLMLLARVESSNTAFNHLLEEMGFAIVVDAFGGGDDY